MDDEDGGWGWWVGNEGSVEVEVLWKWRFCGSGVLRRSAYDRSTRCFASSSDTKFGM